MNMFSELLEVATNVTHLEEVACFTEFSTKIH